MAITFVSSGEQTTSNDATPFTYTVDIGTRTNGLLLVFVGSVDTVTHTRDTPTWNGVAMGTANDVIGETVSGVWQRISLYYLANPANGSNTFSVNHEEGASDIASLSYIVAAWFDGAHQTQASVHDNSDDDNGSTDPSVGITPSENNELVVAMYASEADAVLTPAHTVIQSQDHGTRTQGTQYVIQTTATTSTMSWTGTDANWIAFGACFREAASGSQTINANFISSTETVYQPAITTTVTVTLNLVSSTEVVYQPAVSVGSVTVSPNLITSTEVVYQPAVSAGSVTVTPHLVTSTEVVYQPAITGGSVTIAPDFVASAEVVYQPSISTGSVTIAPAFIAPSEVVYEPVITSGLVIQAGFISSTATVYDPAFESGAATIAPNSIDSSAVFYLPIFTGGGSLQTISADMIGSGAIVYQVIVALYSVSARRTLYVEYEDRTFLAKR